MESEEQSGSGTGEAKQFAHFLQEARVSAENVVNTLREPLVVLDKDLCVTAVNLRFYETFQVTPEETLHHRLYDLGNGQWNIPELRSLLENILPKNNPFYDYKVEHDFPGIGRKVMLLNARKLLKTEIHPEFILLAIEDLTEHNAREAALYESEERYCLMVKEVLDYAIFMLDSEGRITTWSEGAARMKQYTEEDVIGEHFRMLYSIPDRAKHKPEHELEVVKREGSLRDTYWRRKKDGSLFWADVVMSAMRDKDGKLIGFSKVVKDLTEQKRIRDERERLRELELVEVALTREQHVTEVLERSLLLTPPEEVFPDIFVASCYQPASDEANVGGDFLDAFFVENGRVALVVGDAAGKGLAAAARTAEVKYALRAYLRGDSSVDLAAAVGRLNRFIADYERLDNREGNSFVTLAVALVTPNTGETEFCLAGAEPPIILHANGEVEDMPIGGLALGVWQESVYEVSSMHLDHGDTILITTDGITEARQNGAFLGLEGFKRFAQETRDTDYLVNMGRTILARATEYSGGILRDDACLLLARRP